MHCPHCSKTALPWSAMGREVAKVEKRGGEMMRAAVLLLLFGMLSIRGIGEIENAPVTCVEVLRGDIIKVLYDGKEIPINLGGVRSPELDQPLGNLIKRFTERECVGSTLTLSEMTCLESGAIYAKVKLPDGSLLCEKLAKDGYVWKVSKGYSNDEQIGVLQLRAKREKTGIWSMEDKTLPWYPQYDELGLSRPQPKEKGFLDPENWAKRQKAKAEAKRLPLS